ncbi:MAG: 4Fe-4S dicluster domain-containing protein [Gemmatimonadetes bacterium]|nr:4Fe-4S dicluster domain-containing protein [Gemmatimonadota bacterium]
MKAILVDVTRCTGCERCVDACIEVTGCDPLKAQVDRARAKDGLSENRLLSVPQVAPGRFARLTCMHCLEPSCVSACLVGGITKTPEGPVVYDPAKCIGCRYCMLACPFHIPRYEWDEVIPFVKKCDMCAGRQADGLAPACVEACPNEALRFGERESLLGQAHELIAGGRARYLPRVWGEHEFGGTSVMYVSDVDLGGMGWPDPETVPIPSLTEPLIAKTPVIGLSVASGLLAIHWVIRRRMRLASEAAASDGRDDAALAGAGSESEIYPEGEDR